MKENTSFWEMKMFAYLRLKVLEKIAFKQTEPDATERNENDYTKLIQFLDDCSLRLVMTQARDNGYQALRS